MNILLIGAGGFGKAWRKALAHQGAKVVAIVDPNEENLREAQEYFGLAERNCFLDDETAIAHSQADATLIVSPPHFHATQIRRALEHGLDVLVVKPLAESLETAIELVDLAVRCKRRLVVAQQKRYLPAFLQLRSCIEKGTLGKLGVVTIQLAVKGTAWPSGFDWRSKRVHPVLMGAGSHQFDLMRWVLGREARSVMSSTWNVPWSPFEGQASALSFIEMEDGLPVTYHINWAPKEDQRIDFFSGWRVEGEKGVAIVDKGSLLIDGVSVTDPNETSLGLDDLNVEVLKKFMAYVEYDLDPGITGADNLKSIELLYSAIESAASRKAIDISRRVSLA